jgi:sporadic carbohydrate cluster protein (TIGR04323 family)
MKKEVRGYIFGKKFMGERAPQQVQNIVIRDFCQKNELNYKLSLVEYVFKDSTFMLKEGLKEIKKMYGIVFYSLFQLPENEIDRNLICNFILRKKKKLFFALENIEMVDQNDLKKINTLWLIKKELPNCYKFEN